MKKLRKPLTFFCLAILTALSCGVMGACKKEVTAKEKLKNAYNNVMAEANANVKSCFKLSYDETYVTADSNPLDKDDYLVSGFYDALDKFKKELNFPEYLDEAIGSTAWSMGKQTEEIGAYILTWTYHPDKGLELMCRVK